MSIKLVKQLNFICFSTCFDKTFHTKLYALYPRRITFSLITRNSTLVNNNKYTHVIAIVKMFWKIFRVGLN